MNYAVLNYEMSVYIAETTEKPKILTELYKFWRTKSDRTGVDYVRLYEAIAGNTCASSKLLDAIYRKHGASDGFNIVILLSLAKNPNVPDNIRKDLAWIAKNPFMPNVIRHELMVSS